MISTIQRAATWPRWLQLTWAALGVGFALLVQLPLETRSLGDPFTVFIASVFLSALMLGRSAGWLAVFLSSALSFMFFEPVGTFKISNAFDLIQIQIYAALACGAVVMASSVRDAILKQAEVNVSLSREGKFKSLQLQEMAHRLANNFTSLDALIRHRAAASVDPMIKKGFEQSSELVHIVARLNKRLGSLGEEGIVESQTYLDCVCQDLQACAPPNVSVSCRAENFRLPLNLVIALGLIINELATNAFKYAFPDKRTGTIRVIFSRKDNFLHLLVEDDGVGMDGLIKGSGMGLSLLQAFSNHLKWDVELSSGASGTSASVHLPFKNSNETAFRGGLPRETILH